MSMEDKKNVVVMKIINQIKIMFLATKYNIMKQMLNKVTFITNIIFMILNNAAFIIQWLILFTLKDNIGGYTIKEVLLLWGIAAGTYGIANIFFHNAFWLADLIVEGKLDSFLVQPKNVLLNVICSGTSISAIGDLIYAFICLAIYGINIQNIILFILFIITGGIAIAAFACIVGSLAFWIVKADTIADVLVNMVNNFSTYPGSIFKGTIKILLYTIIPVGISTYMPVSTILNFSLEKLMIILLATSVMVLLAFLIFNRGLKRYSSSNLVGTKT